LEESEASREFDLAHRTNKVLKLEPERECRQATTVPSGDENATSQQPEFSMNRMI